MLDKFVCTFLDEKQHIKDYVSNLFLIRFIKCYSLVLLPMVCALLAYSIYYSERHLTIFVSVMIILLLFMIFIYSIVMQKIIDNNSRIRYGNRPLNRKVIFDDKICIEVKDDRAVLDYDKIKKIVDCGSIYALLYGRNSGTYFAKNSCNEANDEQIIAFLQSKTGAKLTFNRSKWIIATVVLTILSCLFSLFFVYIAII